MPELPEVEHARRWLEHRTQGRVLASLELLDPAVVRSHLSTRPTHAVSDPTAAVAGLFGQPIGAPIRWGKRLGLPIGAPGSPGGLLCHLGMTGRWVAEPTLHARLGLRLDDGSGLWLDDPRRFGCVVVHPGPLAPALREGLGPDALIDAPDGPALREALARRGPIKTALLDQARLAGVGNIQAVESLWAAQIHPSSRADRLDEHAWSRLAAALHQSLLRTLEQSGDGEIVYVSRDASASPFRIYGRDGSPCPRCEAPLVRERLSGRATVRCPSCQPAPVAE